MSPTLTMPLGVPATTTAALDFDELYRSSRDDVFAYAAGIMRDRHAAEEVTAAAFERAYRRRRTYRADRGSARQWLFGITRNAALDELRRRSRQVELAREPSDGDTRGFERDADLAIQRTTVSSAMASLSPRERDLVALKFFAGLSNSEIAGVLGVSPTNAGTLIHRTVTNLRKACHVAP